MEKQGVAGNHGNGVKSDCRIQFEVLQKGGIQIELIRIQST